MDAARASNRTYEEYEPAVEWTRAADADAVKITLPGYKRENIRVLVDNHGHLRTRGERLVADNRWSRFQKDFQLPASCNADGIRAKFENDRLTITLPKHTRSPQSGPVTPPTPALPTPEPPRRPVAAAPSQRLPPALPEPAARPTAPPTVPAAPLAPAASVKPPAAERAPSMPKKPSAPAPAPEVEPRATTKPQSSMAAVPTPREEEEEKQRQMEAAGKMAEDRKEKATEKQQEEAAMPAEMAMVHQPRPASASRGLLVAVVVLLGITVYVWHSLKNATGGAGEHGHGHLGAGSYGDEM